MCECGCAQQEYRAAVRLGKNKVVSYQVFPGCDDCDYGPGFAISFFNDKGAAEWCDGIEEERLVPDEYGGHGGHGLSVGLFDVQDLRKAASELEKDGIDFGQYSFDEALEEHGGELVRKAIWLHRERIEAEDKRRRAKP